MKSSWNIPGLVKKVEGKIPAALNVVGEHVKGEAKILCPTVTGNLKNSINHKVINNDRVRIGTPVEYAPYIEFGTKPHTILPKNGNLLVFKINGVTVFAKKVEHPGTKKQSFLRPALYNNKQAILKIFNNAMKLN